MTLKLSDFNVMEYLWDTLDKTQDGNHILYSPLDVEQLWWMGFVDTMQFDLNNWKRIFEPFKQPNGSFLLGRGDFLGLDKYRYKGEIRIPFDAMKINEGKYTDDGLRDLIDASIAPSCSLPDKELRDFFDQLKKDFRQPDDLILIKKPAKQKIKSLLEAHPSPLRNLEIILDHMFEQKSKEIEGKIEQEETAAATAEAALQASRFSSTATNVVEEKAQGFKEMAKTKKQTVTADDTVGARRAVPLLKNLKRSKRGMRG